MMHTAGHTESLIARALRFFGARLRAGEPSVDYDTPYSVGDTSPEIEPYSRRAAIASARELMRNDATSAGIANRLQQAVVGTGIQPSARTVDGAWNDAAESWWADWSDAPEVTGTKSLVDIQRAAVVALLTDGGIALRLRDDGLVEVVELDRLRAADDNDLPYLVDDSGRVAAWMIAPRTADGLGTPEAVPVERVLMLAHTARAEQIVPHPMLAPVVNDLRNLSELQGYAMRAYKTQSATAATFERADGAVGLAHAANGLTARRAGENKQAVESFARATGMTILDARGKLSPVEVKAPGVHYDSFTAATTKRAAMAIGLPYEFLTLFFGQSYSASRATLSQAHATISVWQDRLIRTILRPLFVWRVAMAIRAGEIPPAPCALSAAVDWQRPAFDWIDPADATQSDLVAIRAGLMTAAEAAEKRGQQLDAVLEARAREIALVQSIALRHGIEPSDLSTIVIAGDTTAPKGNAE